jgi:CBS domain-containing protein
LNVRELMGKDFVIVKPGTKITAATQVMKERGSSCVVVGESKKPVGIVTENDFVVRVLSAGKDPHTTPVSAIMSSSLIHVEPETSILDAIAIMHEKNFSQLPVLQRGRMVGLVRLTDLMRYLVGFFSAHRW